MRNPRFRRSVAALLAMAAHVAFTTGDGGAADDVGPAGNKQVEEIRGKADAKATEIYASAYNQSPEALDFYEFLKTMETYQEILSEDSTVVLSTDSDLFTFLKNVEPGASKSAAPASPPKKPTRPQAAP